MCYISVILSLFRNRLKVVSINEIPFIPGVTIE